LKSHPQLLSLATEEAEVAQDTAAAELRRQPDATVEVLSTAPRL
jgi:hypothetical protein